MPDQAKRLFWGRVKRLTLGLLAAWLLVNLAVPWFARALNDFSLFGFPLGYWLAAEGVMLLYLGIVVVYVFAMDRLEAAYLAHAAAETDRKVDAA
jgi:putative solute:sodium symporter small subunit